MEKLIYGHIVDIEFYKDLLLKEGIVSMIKNEFEEASLAGFGSGLPGNADLYVDDLDIEKAQAILKKFNETNQ